MAPSGMTGVLPARDERALPTRSEAVLPERDEPVLPLRVPMLRLTAVAVAATALALLAGCATSPSTAPAAGTRGTAATAPAPATPAAPRAGPVALVNPGFETPVAAHRSDPEGWFTFQHAGDKSYTFALDSADPHGGARSLRIDYIGPEPYGAVAQPFEVGAHAGKLARYTAWMRTRDVGGPGAGLTLLLLSKGAVVSQNFMDDKLVTGTTGWTRYTLTLPIPQGAGRIEVGAMLQGKGSLWLDDAVLEIVDP